MASFLYSYSSTEIPLTEQRSKLVNNCFPRLLYMFSEILCYVTTSSKAERQTLVNLLVSYGRVAASGTINQRRLPELVIVFNKVAADQGKWDLSKASKDFRDEPELKKFFRTITVVDILTLTFSFC